jgi:hypothetical protein
LVLFGLEVVPGGSSEQEPINTALLICFMRIRLDTSLLLMVPVSQADTLSLVQLGAGTA